MNIDLAIPPRILHPNARPHWAALARAKAKYRHQAEMVCRSVMGPEPRRWEAATVACAWRFPVRRKRDQDGLTSWLKAGIDGLVSAGLLLDDDRLTWLPHTVEPCERGREGVTLTVKPAAG